MLGGSTRSSALSNEGQGSGRRKSCEVPLRVAFGTRRWLVFLRAIEDTRAGVPRDAPACPPVSAAIKNVAPNVT